MKYNRIVISSGHSQFVRGACGVLDEVNEARRVVEHVADCLSAMDIDVIVFHDDTSTSQQDNLETIVAFHNDEERDLDVSVHFNAYVETAKPMGTECLYLSQSELATKMADAISACGFVNRGAKKRTDLYFLNHTDMPAILIETCFVDSHADAEIYREHFDAVCEAIAGVLAGKRDRPAPPQIAAAPIQRGKASWFGGPNDTGVSADEGLAFIYEVEQAPHLFLPQQPPNTSGLARRLDPDKYYIAMRFDYDDTPKDMLLDVMALVRSPKTGRSFWAYPADWGPHEDTDRLADLSPGLMDALGITTDDEVEVLFPVYKQKPKVIAIS